MSMKGYQQYKQQSVETMTDREMLFLLYDESIKRLTMAQYALEDKNYQTFEESLERVRRIIHYLSAILDKKYPISADLERLYEYFLYQITRAKVGRRTEIILDLKEKLQELRDTFREADKKASSAMS